MERHYRLLCIACGRDIEDSESGFSLECRENHPPSLLRAVYRRKTLTVRPELPGIFRYADWLPARRTLESAGSPVVYQSSGLADALGMDRLYIAFSGYWPRRGALLETCSFKELEALSVCARAPLPSHGRTLVVSSAGNTGRAFLQIGSITGIPMLVVIPESALSDMWTTVAKPPGVNLGVLVGGGDYLDAIELGNRIAARDGFYSEGGAKNVARRDGLGTVLLAAAEAIGEIPAHYFQAVGSGTGGIAAWEMSMRLREDGRYGDRAMKLHFVQNDPFAIMAEAWHSGSRQLPFMSEEKAKAGISRLHSKVLSNRKPPYGITGGVFDALTDTGGHMYSVSNAEARDAGLLFESLEGCDPDPAAQVALAGLIHAVKTGKVDTGETVLLNMTGGGKRLLEKEGRMRKVTPDFIFTMQEARDFTKTEMPLTKVS